MAVSLPTCAKTLIDRSSPRLIKKISFFIRHWYSRKGEGRVNKLQLNLNAAKTNLLLKIPAVGIGSVEEKTMISYQVYKIIHFLGIFTVLMSLAATATLAVSGNIKNSSSRKSLMILHGVGLFFILLGGFGLMARIGVSHGGIPMWVWAKIGIWLVLGSLAAGIKRSQLMAKNSWSILLLLGGTAAFLALYKPF